MDKPRWAIESLNEHLGALRGIVVSGPRQSGKTTLLKQLCRADNRRLVSFDDPTELGIAISDPTGYVSALPHGSAIDEFQRAGNPFLLAMKAKLDQNSDRGQVLLAGSTSFLTSKRLADSLAGRVGIVELWPLSLGEIEGHKETFLDSVFRDPESLRDFMPAVLTRGDAAELIVRGGFPEVVTLPGKSRRLWFRSYLSTITTKDVIEQVGEVRKIAEFRRLLELVIARTAEEARSSALSDDSGLHITTVNNYLQLANDLLLTHELPAWTTSATTRAKRHPKRYVVDTGLAASVLGVDQQMLSDIRSNQIGTLLETFVVNELAKQRGWSQTDVRLHHYRDRDGSEVDVVLVGPGQRIVGVEVKASTTVTTADAKHLIKLRDKLGEQFIHGYVVHLGDRPRALGPRITAIPLAMLWT